MVSSILSRSCLLYTSVNSYLREIDAIKGLEELIFHNSITFFVGENGSGKSTLLEALAAVSYTHLDVYKRQY